MSTRYYAGMATEELLQRFIDLADRLGCYFERILDGPPPPPEHKPLIGSVAEISAELLARNPEPHLRALLHHDSRGVRFWAAKHFSGVDPELASAAQQGLFSNLSTQDVIDACERALRPPPAHPTLQEMSVDQLVERFEDACLRIRDADRFLSDDEGMRDIATHNRLIAEVGDVALELEARKALSALLPLLDHPVAAVRLHAAYPCRQFAPERARAVVDEIAADRTDPLRALEAGLTRRRWDQGAPSAFDPD